MKLFSQIISWVCMPILMPIYSLLIVFYTETQEDYIFNEHNLWNLPDEIKWSLIKLFFIFCVVAPGISFLLLRNRKLISNIEMDEKKERFVPIFIMGLYCFALFYLLYSKTEGSIIPKLIYLFALSGAAVSFINLFLNRFFKISLHATGSGILIGFLIAYYSHQQYFPFYLLPLCVVFSGIVMSARYYLKKHTLKELLIGWGIGITTTFFCCKIPDLFILLN